MCPGTLEIIFFLGQNCQHKIKALTSFCQKGVELPNNRVWRGWAGSVDKSRCISNSSRHKNFSYLGMEIVLPSSHSKQPKFRGKNTWEPSLVWDWILDCYGDHFIIGPTTHMEQNSLGSYISQMYLLFSWQYLSLLFSRNSGSFSTYIISTSSYISFETVRSTNVNVQFISLMNDRASGLYMSENVL